MKFTPELVRSLCDGSICRSELESLDPREVRRVRSDPDNETLRYVDVSDAILVREDGESGKTTKVTYVMSTEKPVGFFKDSILVKGWKLQDFERRGRPFLYNHNLTLSHSELPLGHMSNVRRSKLELRSGQGEEPALVGDAVFTPDGMSPFNDLVRQMVEAGELRGGSVGFVPMKSREPTEEEVETHGFGPYSEIFIETNLIEFSATAVGMDPDAVTLRARRLSSLEARLAEVVSTGQYDPEVVQQFRRVTHGLEPELSTRSVVDFGRGVHERRVERAEDVVERAPSVQWHQGNVDATATNGNGVTFTLTTDQGLPEGFEPLRVRGNLPALTGVSQEEVDALRAEVDELKSQVAVLVRINNDLAGAIDEMRDARSEEQPEPEGSGTTSNGGQGDDEPLVSMVQEALASSDITVEELEALMAG